MDTIAPRLIRAAFPLLGLSLVFLALRLGCKQRRGARLWFDDGLLVFAWICHAAFVGLCTAATKHGIGRHIADLTEDNEYQSHKLLAISYFFAVTSLGASKTSFALTLMRLSQQLWEKVAFWFIIISMNVLLAISNVFLFTSCSPVDKVFSSKVEGTCLDPKALLKFNTAAHSYAILVDFALVCYPWYLFWGNMNLRKFERFGLCVAMSCGILSGIAGTVRVVKAQDGVKWKDWPRFSIDVLTWMAAETSLVIMAASIPFLRPLVRQVRAWIPADTKSSLSLGNRFTLGTPPKMEPEQLGKDNKFGYIVNQASTSDEEAVAMGEPTANPAQDHTGAPMDLTIAEKAHSR